jgi:hypothetical protein
MSDGTDNGGSAVDIDPMAAAATVTDPSGDGGTVDNSGGNAGGSDLPSWMSSLPDAYKQDADLAKYPSVGDLVAAHKGVMGKAVIPGADATAEAKAEFRKALGVPDTADGYQFDPKPVEGLTRIDSLEASFRKIAHDNGLTPKQAEAALQGYYDIVGSAWTENQKAAAEKKAENDRKRVEQDTALKSLWGDKHDANVAAVESVFTRPELAEAKTLFEGMGVWDHPSVRRMLFTMAERTLSDSFPDSQGAGGSGGLKPGEAHKDAQGRNTFKYGEGKKKG